MGVVSLTIVRLRTMPLCYANDSVSFYDRPECKIIAKTGGLFDSIAGVRIVLSLLGILGSASIIILALLKKRVFNPEVHPIFMLAVADCALAVMWIAGGSIWLAPAQSYNNGWCYAVTLLTVMLECVTINLILVYAIFAFISTSKTDLNSLLTHINRGIGWKFVTLVYSIAWFLPVILVLLVFGSIAGSEKILGSIDHCTCWCIPTIINVIPFAWPLPNANDSELYEFINHQHDLIYGLGVLIVLNYITVFVALLVLYFKILRRIKEIRKEHDEILFGRGYSSASAVRYGTAESSRIVYGQSRARKRVLIFLTLFLFSGLCNILVTVILIAFLINRPYSNQRQYHPGQHTKRFNIFISFLFVQSVTIGLQGFMNAIAYGWTREDFVQIITVPLTNEEVENDSNRQQNPKHELEISDTHDTCVKTRSSLIETLYNYSSSIESDVN